MPVDECAQEVRLVKDRLAWALGHPAVSDWVKRGLASARQRDPVEVLNDLELMTHVVRQWASADADAKRAETMRAESLPQGEQTLPGWSQ